MMIIILKNCFYPPGRNYIILLSYMSRCFVCVRACECQRERERERERDRERETEVFWVPVQVMLSQLRDRTYYCLVEWQNNLRKPTISINKPS